MDAFLHWFDRHKYGVIGTLLLHTTVIFAFAISALYSTVAEDEAATLQVDVEAPREEFVELEPFEPDPAQLAAQQEVTNAVNNAGAAEEARLERIDPYTRAQIEEGVWNDLKLSEQEEFQRLAEERRARGEEIVMPQLDPSKWDKERYMEKKAAPVAVTGPVTVDHTFHPRALDIRVPAYLCKGQGKVTLNVRVDAGGNISDVKVDASGSTTNDACMIDYARERTEAAHFSAGGDQRGSIIFIFLAQ